MKKIINTLNSQRYNILFTLLLIALIAFLIIVLPMDETKNIIKSLEEKTFDLRQRIISKKKQANKDIIIVSVDNPSYEQLIETYGDWPIPRHIYAKALNYIQEQNPKFVAFDLIFIKSLNRIKGSDIALADSFKKHPNTYSALSFDNYEKEIRNPPILNEKFHTDIVNNSDTITPIKFSNSRIIMDDLVNATKNLGHINITKSDDGVIRSIPIIINYPRYDSNHYSEIKNEYYLYMTVKMAIDYLNKYENANIKEIEISPDNRLILGNRKIPLTNDAKAILNWYGESGMTDKNAFQYVSFWKVFQSMKAKEQGKKALLPENLFKDKIVYIGTNIDSLSDIKTVPTSKHFPGVEIHATLFNNIIDNNFIHKAALIYDLFICFILSLLSAYTAFKIRSVPASIMSFAVLCTAYIFFTIYTMEKYNVWIWVIVPLVIMLITYTASYIIKYLLKSRDFEYTYKLATTDGLTELYNHRFFQEKIRAYIKEAEKYKNHFSIILIDIDFFKKFNDKYGHQAGDAVLKQVAAILKKNVRNGDYVCRYGGEEMTILLNNIPEDIAIKTANKICENVASKKYKLSQELEVNVTISLGVATYPENGRTPEELIEYADKYLYKAKENGRNQVGNK